VPANNAQAEDRCYRLGQRNRVTVEYMIAAGTLDGFVSELLSAKMALIAAVEADRLPSGSLLAEIEARLRSLGPALLQEARAAQATGDAAARIAALAATGRRPPGPREDAGKTPLAETGQWEFASTRDPAARYRVTFGRAGHLECTCQGFAYRGNCKHVQEVRGKVLGG